MPKWHIETINESRTQVECDRVVAPPDENVIYCYIGDEVVFTMPLAVLLYAKRIES